MVTVAIFSVYVSTLSDRPASMTAWVTLSIVILFPRQSSVASTLSNSFRQWSVERLMITAMNDRVVSLANVLSIQGNCHRRARTDQELTTEVI